MTFYQVSKRIQWDLSTKRYSIATRFEDIERASSLYGETEYSLIDKLNRAGNQVVLFSNELGPEKKFSTPKVLDKLKEKNIARGVEISNLEFADAADYRRIINYLATVEPKLVILRSLGDTDVPLSLLKWLSEKDVILGTVEFRSNKPTEKIVQKYGLDWVRLHRVFDKEIGTLTRVESEARYERAVQERNIGVIEYRLPLNTEPSTHIEIINSIRHVLSKSGYQTSPIDRARGTGKGIKSPTFLILALIVISLSLLSLILWPDRSSRSKTIIIGFPALTAASSFGLIFYPTITRQLATLILAVMIPPAGYVFLKKFGFSFKSDSNFLSPFLDLLWVSVFSTFGGLIISSLLLEEPFLLKLQQFRGVKVSLFFPLIVLILLVFRRADIGISDIKIDYKKGLASLVLLSLFLFLLFRSGNFTFLRSSDIEEAVRRWLENTLYVRPRFKEFVIGHPSMIAWLYFAGRYSNRFQFCKLGLLLLGFVGQISIVNTFAHIHTPIIISLIRTGNGLIGGLILGALLFAVILGGEYVWNLRKG